VKNNLFITNLLVIVILISIYSCDRAKKLDDNKIPTTSTDTIEDKELIKTLFFDEPTDNEPAFKLEFQGNSVLVSREGNSGKTFWTKNLQFTDGKIISEDGRTDWLELKDNALRSFDGEEETFYPFNLSKSNSSIQEVLNQSANSAFQDETLKNGENIIKIIWGKEIKTNYDTDMSYSGSRYASKSFTVPIGKKWILLYIDEDYTFESGLVVGSVPDLFIDKKENKIGSRRFSNKNDINLSRAKDENIKIYSNSTIKAISSRTNGKGVGDDFIDYKGEMWFLEIND
jgi:sporulation protein YlmC with PRC-barrel domain